MWVYVWTLPGSKEVKSGNRRSVMVIRSLWQGRAGLARFCGYMNITPPVHSKAFQSHFDDIRNATVTKVVQRRHEDQLQRTSWPSQRPVHRENNCLDIGVSCDGSWACKTRFLIIIIWASSCNLTKKSHKKADAKSSAIAYHSASTTEHPQLQYCPVGPTSWCPWQQDPTYQPKEPLPRAVVDVIWKRCPKEKFHGLRWVKTAVANAVCHWNSGAHSAEAAMREVRVTPGLLTTRAFDEEDRNRLYAAKRSAS